MVKLKRSQSVRTEPDGYTSDYDNVPLAEWVKKKKGKEEDKITDMGYIASGIRWKTKTSRGKIFEESDVNITTNGFTMGRFDMLPSDIILDILSRLPTESVVECRLVCRNWRNVVRNPSFFHKHLQNQKQYHLDSGKLSFLFFSNHPYFKKCIYTEYDESCHATPFNKEIKMDLNLPFEKYRFVGACNGLICFQAGSNENPEKVFICNPITREYVILPEFEDLNEWAGFGYSASTNEYKVVRVHSGDGMGIVHVYTVGSGNGWRNVGNMDLHLEKGFGVFANGALYWLHRSENAVIFAFGLTDERFTKFGLPERAPRDFFLLGAFDDILRVNYYNYNGIRECEIWSLKMNHDNNDLSWSKEFSVVGTSIPRPFGITKSGKLLYGISEICSYDPKSSPAKKKLGFGNHVIYEVVNYRRTFISLKVLGEKDTSTMECSPVKEQVEARGQKTVLN